MQRPSIREIAMKKCTQGFEPLRSWLTTKLPANWKKFGNSAGPIRNVKMAEYADGLICVHNGSKGSLHMLWIARAIGLSVFELDTTK